MEDAFSVLDGEDGQSAGENHKTNPDEENATCAFGVRFLGLTNFFINRTFVVGFDELGRFEVGGVEVVLGREKGWKGNKRNTRNKRKKDSLF